MRGRGAGSLPVVLGVCRPTFPRHSRQPLIPFARAKTNGRPSVRRRRHPRVRQQVYRVGAGKLRRAATSHLVVWLHAPGQVRPATTRRSLEGTLRERTSDPAGTAVERPSTMDAHETEFIRKTIDDVVNRYAIDASRVVLHGDRAGVRWPIWSPWAIAIWCEASSLSILPCHDG